MDKGRIPTDEPPPPYSEDPEDGPVTPPAEQQHQASQQTPSLPPPTTQVKPRFPPSFNLYRSSAFMQRLYTIGEHQATPLYAVSLHSGLSGRAHVIIHSGPADTAPPLATVNRALWGLDATITLPPLPGSSRDPAEVEEHLAAKSGGFGAPAYAFSVEAGTGAAAALRREAFEWRHSSGDAVQSLGGRVSGWKLVRLATDAPAGLGPDARFVPGAPGSASSRTDGKEVVAVWSWAGRSYSNKTLLFRFLGTGASGALGERWGLMAVVTALRIWDRERRQRNQRAAGGAAAG
ncbi:hypothetical protein GGR54DRAFT_11548 [Hypoxylon sp. NC1633]|nr:hypothetical protein GGR54DRAFT_11548 [Hypoxylon sp. NC1633]